MMNDKTTENSVEGEIVSYRFRNAENDYSIIQLKEKSAKQRLTAVGHCPAYPTGTSLQLTGQWVTDEKFGQQFNFTSHCVAIPDTVNGLRRYLASGMVKGIGSSYADKIVARFGLQTIEIIDKDPERLAEVPGIGEKRIDSIRKAWAAQKDIQDVMIFLQSLGVSSAFAWRIYKALGKDAISKIQANPYQLADNVSGVSGIGFKTADKIARSVNIPFDSPFRICAGLTFALSQSASASHCYRPIDELVDDTIRLLEIENSPLDKNDIFSVIPEMIIRETIILEYGDRVYLPSLYRAEKRVAERIAEVLAHPSLLPYVDTKRAAAWAENQLKIKFSPSQISAIECFFKSRFSVITGGPGVGKSTLLRGLIIILKKLNLKVSLTAPTGRAAKRISEITGEEAATIHRLLEINPATRDMSHQNFKLATDVLIVDECSMMDVHLCSSLLNAIHSSTAILFIGDPDQLPSVGPGDVLKDLIVSGIIPVARLTQIFRQGEGSMISSNAKLINEGKLPVFRKNNSGPTDCLFIEKSTQQEILDEIVHLVTNKLPDEYKIDPWRDVLIIPTMHKDLIGVNNLNKVLQNQLNPHGQAVIKGNREYRAGDKCMMTVNDYEKNVFNGDQGIIQLVDMDEGVVIVNFDDRLVTFDIDTDLDQLVLSYALTVHKAQGGEAPVVILPLHTSHYMLLQRAVLYTACTRARSLLIIVGSRQALHIAVRNSKAAKRSTALAEKLIAATGISRVIEKEMVIH